MKEIRSRAYLDLANGQACIRCGTRNGTIVAAHYNGLFGHRLGRGAGIKAHDFCVAHLCSPCHQYFDSYEDGNDAARAAEFFALILDTMARTYRMGGWSFNGAADAYPVAA